MMSTDEVRRVLEATVMHRETPPRDRVEEVFVEAARMASKRQWTAAASIAGVLVLTAGILVVPRWLATEATVPGTFGGGVAAVSPSPAPSPSAEGHAVVDQAQLLEVLTALLPPGVTATSDPLIEGDPMHAQGFVSMVLHDAFGRTTVQLNVQQWSTTSAYEAGTLGPMANLLVDVYDCARQELPGNGRCELSVLPDGTRVMTVDRPSTDTRATSGIRHRIVDLLRPTGLRVVLAESNGLEFKRGPVTRSTPVLTMDQMRSIVTSDRWWQPA